MSIEQDSLSLPLMEALSHIWAAIRQRHPDVPPVVLLPAPAIRRNVLGHFAPLRWRAPTGDALGALHEVVVTAEFLHRGSHSVLEVLLHEAAHAMNFVRGKRDCTKSQYHNKKFRDAALELGLTVQRVKHYGFALTGLPSETAAAYQTHVDHLETVLIHRRSFHARPGGPKGSEGTNTTDDGKPRSRNRKATCACGFIIRVSKKTMENTVIRCDCCEEPFSFAS